MITIPDFTTFHIVAKEVEDLEERERKIYNNFSEKMKNYWDNSDKSGSLIANVERMERLATLDK
jgi:hypothetical protein